LTRRAPAAVDNLTRSLASLPARLLVAVSGGVDSCVLLHALAVAGKKPIVLHFNHRWRLESEEEEQFVRQLAASNHFRFIAGRARSNLPRQEAAARAARWHFFEKTAAKLDCCQLALAHHADDQVETFLLQLLRGTGSGGGGMRPVAKRGHLIVHRPWLAIWRREIEAYARRNKLDWREDASNRDAAFLRNRIRRQLIPYLRKNFSKNVTESFWRAAEIRAGEVDWLESVCRPEAKMKQLAVKKMAAMPVAQQRLVLRLWLIEGGIADIGFSDIEAVRGLLSQTLPAKVNLSRGKFARRRGGQIFIE
jgi:tRNA(Ile)-lysidine synthase